MLSTSLPRKVVVLLLLAILTVPFAAGAMPDRDTPRRESTFLTADLLGRLWSVVQSAWSETACRIDPNGGCAPGTTEEPQPGPETDEGCHIDPDGRCSA